MPRCRNAPVFTVTVEESGDIALNRDAISLEALQAGVQDLMTETQETVIVINADEAVTHGRVIAVMDETARDRRRNVGDRNREGVGQVGG